jgi:DNA-directed RNA polymerase subunit RPC12/RpoP
MGIILDILKEIPLTAILRERLADQDKRMAALEVRVKDLEGKLELCESEKEDLRRQLEEKKKAEEIKGNLCPYCRHRKGQLLRLTPHPLFGEVGVKIGIYKCENCGKEYEKEHHP